MSYIKTLAILMVAAIGLTGCQTTSEKMAESGAVQITKAEMTENVSDKTIRFRNGKGSGYYYPDGVFEYIFNGKRGVGSWSVTEEGTLCLKVLDWWGYKNHCNWNSYKKEDVLKTHDIEKNEITVVDFSTVTEGNTL